MPIAIDKLPSVLTDDDIAQILEAIEADKTFIESPSDAVNKVIVGVIPEYVFVKANDLGNINGGFMARRRAVNENPAHFASFSINVNGVDIWYEIDEALLYPDHFNAAADRQVNGVFNGNYTDDSEAIKAADAHSVKTGKPVYYNKLLYGIPSDEPFLFQSFNVITPELQKPTAQGPGVTKIKLDSTEDWGAMIEGSSPNSVFVFQEGRDYIATAPVDVPTGVDLECETLHGVRVQASFRFRNGSDISFRRLHLVPPTGGRIFDIVNSLVSADSCKYSLDDGNGGTVVPISSGSGYVAQMSHGALLLQSNFGDTIGAFGGYTGSNSVIAVNYGSYLWQSAGVLKVGGVITESYIQDWLFGGTGTAITVTGSTYFANHIRFEGTGKGLGKNLIGLQRDSQMRINAHEIRDGKQCGLMEASNGIAMTNDSRAAGDAWFENLVDGVDLTGGGSHFSQGNSTTFSNVDKEVRADNDYRVRTGKFDVEDAIDVSTAWDLATELPEDGTVIRLLDGASLTGNVAAGMKIGARIWFHTATSGAVTCDWMAGTMARGRIYQFIYVGSSLRGTSPYAMAEM